MTKYIHELPDWPRFRWSLEALAQRLADVRHKQVEYGADLKHLTLISTICTFHHIRTWEVIR